MTINLKGARSAIIVRCDTAKEALCDNEDSHMAHVQLQTLSLSFQQDRHHHAITLCVDRMSRQHRVAVSTGGMHD